MAAVLSRASTLSDVAATHVTALDAEIRTLRLRRAVLSTVASRGSTMKEAQLMHKLATLSARERQQIIDDFVAEAFQGADPESPAMGVARGMEHAGRALAEGIAPGSAEGKAVLDRIVPPDTPPDDRARLLSTLETFTDARIERYWQLLAIINGWATPPSAVPAFEWLIAALRA